MSIRDKIFRGGKSKEQIAQENIETWKRFAYQDGVVEGRKQGYEQGLEEGVKVGERNMQSRYIRFMKETLEMVEKNEMNIIEFIGEK